MTPFRSPLTHTVRVAASQSSSRPCAADSRVSSVRHARKGKGKGLPHHHVALLELVVPRLPLPAAVAAGVGEVAAERVEHPALRGLERHAGARVEARPDHAQHDAQ